MAVDLALKSESEGWEKNSALQSAFGALAKRDHELAIAKLEGLKGTELAVPWPRSPIAGQSRSRRQR
jgi:hypothetical protein